MGELIIHDIEDSLLKNLAARAEGEGRSLEDEAKHILQQAVQTPSTDVFDRADAFRLRLQLSGRTFRDSVELLREDRAR